MIALTQALRLIDDTIAARRADFDSGVVLRACTESVDDAELVADTANKMGLFLDYEGCTTVLIRKGMR